MWLSLGNLYSETTTLSANIRLDNIGDLCSFAKITVLPKGISNPFMHYIRYMYEFIYIVCMYI